MQTHHPAARCSVGVVIPVYNRRSILLETLTHVLGQTRLPDKLVIVDDGSTDGTATAVEALLRSEAPPIEWKVIRKEKESAAAARAVGFEEVNSLDLVAFLDSDDHWPVDFLQRTAPLLAANPDAAAISVDRQYVEASGDSNQATDCRPLAEDPIRWFFDHGAGIASCTLCRTAAVIAVGGWKPELEAAEDAELFCGLALTGRWLHAPGEGVKFHLGNAAERAEANNLSRHWADSQLRWVNVYETIYQHVLQRVPQREVRSLRTALAARWSAAGRQQLRLGEAAQARSCYRRALQWNPRHLRTWRRLVAAGVAWGS